MDLVHKYEWEYIKQQPSFWNKYEKPIPREDRDLAVFDLGNAVIFPKFFIQNNYEELAIHQVGVDIIARRDLSQPNFDKISYDVEFLGSNSSKWNCNQSYRACGGSAWYYIKVGE